MKTTVMRILAGVLGLMGAGLLFSGCNYARMNNDEAIDLYEEEMPETPLNAIPLSGGVNALLLADAAKLNNPLIADTANVQRGQAAYQVYCSQCHGPEAQGFGTVGQSFAPLPTNLHGNYVQQQSDGQIFARMSLGFKRHPPMYWTVSERKRWEIVTFIRSLEP